LRCAAAARLANGLLATSERRMAGLDGFISAYGWPALIGAAFALASGGFTKGVVGFALPLVSLSIMGSFLPLEVAVALLIMPTLVSNAFQSMRNGFVAAWGSMLKYWRMNLVLVVTIALSAQLVVWMPAALLFAILGVSITLFGISQLVGWRMPYAAGWKNSVEVGVALIGGFFGGISGIWGPPLIMYLIAAETPKVEMVRVQSLCFLFGAIVLVGAHLRSGVLNDVTLPLSAWLVLPTAAAMFLGYGVQDRLDQALFRRITLIVLIVSGLNLLRRAFFV
jgi:uncharacterized membrane protein YfcA